MPESAPDALLSRREGQWRWPIRRRGPPRVAVLDGVSKEGFSGKGEVSRGLARSAGEEGSFDAREVEEVARVGDLAVDGDVEPARGIPGDFGGGEGVHGSS